MVIRMPRIVQAKQILRQSKLFANQAMDVPKGYFAVYVGESQKKRFIVPVLVLNNPSFQEFVKGSRGRIRIQSSYGRSHNSL
ncbi:hypothetical protein V6N13_089961 [Hibiscus sabdariffa]